MSLKVLMNKILGELGSWKTADLLKQPQKSDSLDKGIFRQTFKSYWFPRNEFFHLIGAPVCYWLYTYAFLNVILGIQLNTE